MKKLNEINFFFFINRSQILPPTKILNDKFEQINPAIIISNTFLYCAKFAPSCLS